MTSGARVQYCSCCDVAGTVADVGQDYTSDVKPEDLVYGVCHCANKVSAALYQDGDHIIYSSRITRKMAPLPSILW